MASWLIMTLTIFMIAVGVFAMVGSSYPSFCLKFRSCIGSLSLRRAF